MKYCKNCGHSLKEGAMFCPECGTTIQKLENTEQISKQNEKQSQSVNTEDTRHNRVKKPLSKKSKIITLILVILGIVLFGSYYTINKMMMSPEAVSSRFVQALKEKDTDLVREFINEGQLEVDATKEDAKTFMAFLHEHPKMITAISDQLANDTQMYNTNNNNHFAVASNNDSNSLATLKKDGKKWFIFDHYVVQILPVYIEVGSSEDKSNILVGDKEVGTVGSDNTRIFGPFLPGVYVVKAVVEGGYGKVEIVQEVDFSTMEETETSSYFDFQSNYVEMYTDNDDAILYVNGKSTKKKIGDIGVLGPVPKDGSIELYAQKEFSSGVRKSNSVKITEDTYDVDLYLDYNDYDEEYTLAQAESEEQAELEAEEDEVTETIYDHYERISNDDFQSAYNLFSANMKKKFGVDGWAKGLESNIRDHVTLIEVQGIDGNSAKAYMEMTSYDDQEDDSTLVQEWEGYWSLVKEDGKWKLDSTELEKVDSWVE